MQSMRTDLISPPASLESLNDIIEVVCHLRVVTIMGGENPFPAFLTPSLFHVLFVRQLPAGPFPSLSTLLVVHVIPANTLS